MASKNNGINYTGLAIIGYEAHLKILKKVFPKTTQIPWERLPKGVQKAEIAFAEAVVDAYSRAVLV
jgi:hypothetical protein